MLTKIKNYHTAKRQDICETITKATLNAEIPSASQINIGATSWDCEAVDTMKQSSYVSTCGGLRPWNIQARGTV